MPYATNPQDGVRTYYEEWEGAGEAVILLSGYTEPLQYSQRTGLAQALRGRHRLIFADHRGQGRSDKPHEAEAYALPTRVLDVLAVLDASGVDRAHFVGYSWGARLGYAVGEHRPERLHSLVLCGNQPYEWDRDSAIYQAVAAAVAAGMERGIDAFVEVWESSAGERFPEPLRGWMLESDPAALDAAWRSTLTEGPVSRDLSRWRTPCLIYVGAEDEMRDDARRAAAEIPGARFLSLPGHTHYSAPEEVDTLLPHVLELFDLAGRG
jgi:pimeloyl-ACP methyl ester carboxylesterase